VRPLKGVNETERIGPDDVVERYGVQPSQVPDFIALRGDPSDKIPGAPGIGPKKAAAMLARHGTLDAAIRAEGLEHIAAELRMFRQVATMRADAPVPPIPDRSPSWVDAAARAEAWGLGALAGRLRELASL
jgi:DNA polymerase-1